MAVLLECTSCYQSYAVPQQALRGRTSCPWCGAPSPLPPLDLPAEVSTTGSREGFTSGGAFPQLSPSRFPKRRQATPAVLWMIVGIGLGAGVVLAVLSFSPPRFLARDGHSESEQLPAVTAERSPNSEAPTAANPSHQLSPTQGALPTRTEVQAEIERQQLLRQVVREELGRADAEDASVPAEDPQPRWKSDRPPPIGEPDDDSPPLGLMLPERRAMPIRPVEDARESRPTDVAKDDAKAVAALVAAGIRCDKDSDAGRVTRVDGSFRMTDALMAHVAKLPGLVQLKLSFAEVTDAGLAHVKDLTQLEELILNQTKVTDAGLAQLDKLAKLEKLDLEKTLVSDHSIARLKTMKQLSHVDLRGTKVTAPAVASLKEELGGARIRH